MIAEQRQSHGEEIANVITHGSGILLGIAAFYVLMKAAVGSGDPWAISTFAVYVVCMTASYVTSTCYHASIKARPKCVWRRYDHSAIYLHIAGTYTPFSLVMLRHEGIWGWLLFAIVWIAAAIGVWWSFHKMKKNDHVKTACYLAMGCVVFIAFKPLLDVCRVTGTMAVLYWLIAGGAFYIFGSIFFFFDKYKYMHPLWHIFVLCGSGCHVISVYSILG
jgi:hemolysin III